MSCSPHFLTKYKTLFNKQGRSWLNSLQEVLSNPAVCSKNSDWRNEMTLEFLLNSSRILTEELKWLWNYFQILQEFQCRLVIPIGRSENLSLKQMAVKFQADKKTQMASELFFGIISEFFRNSLRIQCHLLIMTGKVETLSQKQTAAEFLKKPSSFPCRNYSKISRRRILGADGYG